MMLNLSDLWAKILRYKIVDSILHRQLGNETILLNLNSGCYYSFNAVGSWIWTLLLEDPKTFTELQGSILREYPVSLEAARQDLEEFLRGLIEPGLLETVE
jgi:hypothetical protein